MLSPLILTPNMDTSTLVSAINDNFRQLEGENRSKTIRDEDGKNRIILGRFPDGTYGLIISKEGVDVLSLFSSS